MNARKWPRAGKWAAVLLAAASVFLGCLFAYRALTDTALSRYERSAEGTTLEEVQAVCRGEGARERPVETEGVYRPMLSQGCGEGARGKPSTVRYRMHSDGLIIAEFDMYGTIVWKAHLEK